MRNISLFVALACLIVSLDSCRSYRELNVLKDVDPRDMIVPKPPTYTIKQNDNLFISIITSDEQLNQIYNPAQAGLPQVNTQVYNTLEGQYVYGYEVDREGKVMLPMIGAVQLEGLNMFDAERAVENRAKEFLKDVTVRVRLLNYKVTVIGEVEFPGVYFNYNSEYTIMDALSAAGGFSDFADLNNVKVIRAGNGQEKVFILDLQDESTLNSPAYFMNPNDILIVPPAKNKNLPLKAPAITLVLAAASTALLLLNVLNL